MKLKRIANIALGALAVSLPLSASAITTIFVAPLSSAGEPVPTSTATGGAVVSFDNVALTVTVQLSFSGLANTSPFGHIHCCTTTAGTGSAPVALNFTPLPAATTATYNNVFSLTSSAFSSLYTGALAGQAYVNIHTPGTYGGGEIRGFLPAQVVPEPGTYAMMLAGLAGLGFMARRRTQG